MTAEKSKDNDECGKYDLESESDISWEVLLRLNNNVTCGGVVVSKNWILTNAECGKSIISYGGSIRNQGITDYHKLLQIKTNCPRISLDRFSSGQEECVSEVHSHPEYKVLLYDMFYYNI